MKNLLSLKHWQLFLLMIGIPFVLYMVGFSQFISEIAMMEDDPEMAISEIQNLIFWALPAGLFVVAVNYLWLWQMGSNLYARLPEGKYGMNFNRFRMSIVFQPVYLVVVLVFVLLMMNRMMGMVETEAPDPQFLKTIPIALATLLPLNLLAVLAQLFSWYFCAKALKSVEWGREASFSDAIGEFVLIWIYPIGIWFIQPRLNRLFEGAE